MKLKLGVLLCDRVSAKYRPEHPSYPEMFSAILPSLQLEFYEVFEGDFPTDLDCCDAWMATGSRKSVYDGLPWIHRMLALVQQLRDEQKIYVGVCFGHQLLAHGLDGEVAKAAEGWSVGVHSLTIHEHKSWMTPFQPELDLLMMCQDQVVALPASSTCLGSTEICPVAMFSVADHMLGIQGHPEFSRDFLRSLIEDRTQLIGANTSSIALESLDKGHQGFLVGQWITQFISQAS